VGAGGGLNARSHEARLHIAALGRDDGRKKGRHFDENDTVFSPARIALVGEQQRMGVEHFL
jgi:hypothetical protein